MPLPDAVIELLAEQALKTRGRQPQDVMRAMTRLVEAEIGSAFRLSDAVIDALLLASARSPDAKVHRTRAFVHLIEFELAQCRLRGHVVELA